MVLNIVYLKLGAASCIGSLLRKSLFYVCFPFFVTIVSQILICYGEIHVKPEFRYWL